MNGQEKQFAIEFDDDNISCIRPDGPVERVRWPDIVKVTIEATAGEVREAPDHIWIIWGKDNRTGCVFPGNSRGIEELLVEMQSRLDGFDLAALASAIRSDENQTWLLWSKEEARAN